MRNCWVFRLMIMLPLFVAVIFGPMQASYAAPVSFTLTRTAPLTSVSDAASSTLYEVGTVSSGGTVVGRFVRTIRTVTGVTEPQNTGIVTITILGLGPAPPPNVTLLGSHDFSSGNNIGGISGSSIPGVTGLTWLLTTVSVGVYTLTVNLP